MNLQHIIFMRVIWQQQVSKNGDGKLCNYGEFKTHFGMEHQY